MFCDQALISFAKLLTSLPLMVINGYVAEALCSMTFSVKPTWSHDTWETLLKLIWSYGEVFEFTQALDEGEEGKCNLRKSFKVIP